MELDAQRGYYSLAGPGGFSGNVCNGRRSVGVVRNLVCLMKKEIARQIPEFSPKKKKKIILPAFPHLQSQSLLEMWIKIRIMCPKKYSKPTISANISQP